MSELARLAVVVSHPTQYYSPWFRYLSANLELKLKVFYLWDFGVTAQRDSKFGKEFKWDIDLLSGHAFEWVENRARNPGTSHFAGLNNPTLGRQLSDFNPNVVLCFGYGWKSLLQLSQSWRSCPLILRGDNHLLWQHTHSSAGQYLRNFFRKRLFRRYQAFAAVGRANSDYYQLHGVPRNRIHFVPHCIDNDRFQVVESETVAEWEQKHQIDSRNFVVLFAGKLEPKKRPDLLLSSFIDAKLKKATLVFVGTGKLEESLKVAAESSSADVRFLGFLNQSEMPLALHASDTLVLPSEGPGETWGLVVNEAMAAGVPAIVSDHVGCGPDLILPGETGWIFRAGDQLALRSALETANKTVPGARMHFRDQTRKHIRNYSYQASAEALKALLADTVLDQSSS